MYMHAKSKRQNNKDERLTVVRKIYLSLYLKGLCVRGSWRRDRTATYCPPHSYAHQRFFPVVQFAQAEARGPSSLLGAGLLYHTLSPTLWSPNSPISKLTDFLSSPSYVIVQSLTHYLPITGHRNVSLPPSLEWHVWSLSSGNNCHAVHWSLSSSALVCDCTVGF